jgi:1,4-dihydroxy-2-naphthoate polyprenyltransferase
VTTALARPLPSPGTLSAWLLAARPATLPVAVAPVLVGTAVTTASGAVRWSAVIAALFGALAIQVGTNFTNDVFDHEKGADDERRLGPTRAVQAGLLSPRAVRIGIGAAFGLATLAGVYLAWIAGPIVIAIGIASIASGLAYTAGPYPRGYHGLGDAFVFGFFGLVAVTGTTFVASGSVPPAAWLSAVPVGALATAVLVVNNVRDYETDVDAGKRTLVVRFGRRFGVVEYASLIAAAFATPVLMATTHIAPLGVLIALAPLPWGVALARRLANFRGAALNPVLASTAKLLFSTSGLLALGFACS